MTPSPKTTQELTTTTTTFKPTMSSAATTMVRKGASLMNWSFLVLFLLLLVPAVAEHPTDSVSKGAVAATEDGDAPLQLFDQIDTDHNGLVDKDEYTHGVAALRSYFQQPSSANDNKSSSSSSSSGSAGGSSTTSRWSFLWSLEGFWKAFTSSFAMILATEVGDKTFFIAAVLSMKHSRVAVFGGAILALVVMTILSTAMGLILPGLIPRSYTHILGGLLFLYFGGKLLVESRAMASGRVSEELEEVEEELLLQSNKKEDSNSSSASLEEGFAASRKAATAAAWSAVAMQSLTLTFVAEWGDRSQIATIALAAAKNPVGVAVGGSLGHCVCTGLAVLGGRMLAARISEKTVSQVGGIIFAICGIHSLFFET